MVFIYVPPCCGTAQCNSCGTCPSCTAGPAGGCRMLVCSNCSLLCFMLILLVHSFLMILILLLCLWNQKTFASSCGDPHPTSSMQQQACQSHSLSTWTLFLDTVVYSKGMSWEEKPKGWKHSCNSDTQNPMRMDAIGCSFFVVPVPTWATRTIL